MNKPRRKKPDITRHGPARSRREFLAQSFAGVQAAVMFPSLLSLLRTDPVLAQELASCSGEAFTPGLPYLAFDLAGGANIAGSNVLVGFERGGGQESYSTAGQYDETDYIRLGLPASMHPSRAGMLDHSYQLTFHSQSGMLRGLESVLANDPDIKARIDGTIFCVRTFDDTQGNQLNTTYLAQKAGARGQVVQLIGQRISSSGGNSKAPFDSIDPALTPSQVNSNRDATSLLSLGNDLMGSRYFRADQDGGQKRVKYFMNRLRDIGQARLEALAQQGGGFTTELQNMLGCSMDQAGLLLQNFTGQALDPSGDPLVSAAFQGADEGVGAVAKLVLDSYAGAGTITVGGCDYHDGTNTRGDAKDEEVGRLIGKCIKLAALKEKSLFIHLYTDGGVTGDSGGNLDGTNGKVIWTSDSGTRSANLILVYKHNHNPATDTPIVRPGMRQIGNYLRAGGADLTANITSNDIGNLTKVVALNYLAAMGREGEFERIFGRAAPAGAMDLIALTRIFG